jgi:hypothetical protein
MSFVNFRVLITFTVLQSVNDMDSEDGGSDDTQPAGGSKSYFRCMNNHVIDSEMTFICGVIQSLCNLVGAASFLLSTSLCGGRCLLQSRGSLFNLLC